MTKPTIDRRGLLAGLGLASTAASAAAGPRSSKPARPAFRKGLPDVVVVGAGAFGGWAALELRERGYNVTLVDAYGPGNAFASSAGETRNIRAGYGDRGIYSAWAAKAWVAWHERQEEFGRRLIYPSGSLRDPGPEQMAEQVAVYEKLKLPYEMLTAEEVSRRWPQIRTDDLDRIFYDIHSGSVKAREASIAVAEAFERKGGKIILGRATPGAASAGRLESVMVNDEPLAAGQFVFACGPWLAKLFPEILGDKIIAHRAELFFVGPAPDDTRYRWDNVPSISDQITYTTADIGGGYKIAAQLSGVTLDPDEDERLPTPFLKKQVEGYVKRRLPGLVGRPVVQTYVGPADHTSTGHYIFDRHPDWANALIAGGGSGHAFKMGPVLGVYAADRIAGLPQPAEYEAVFSLAAHCPVKQTRRDRG
jgi:sarcosine oxidase